MVHDWLYGMRGGEFVLEDLLDLWPLADVHTLFYRPELVSAKINGRAIHPSALWRLPGAARWHRQLLPLYPWAMRGMKLDGYDLVISVSSCAAKAAPVPAGTPHLCYCLSPARYFYDQYEHYFGRLRGPKGVLVRRAIERLIEWDRATAASVTRFVAISYFVAERIRRLYGREAEVVYPGVATEYFTPGEVGAVREDFFLTVCSAVPYKRLDLIVEAFNVLGWPLMVVTRGPELEALRRIARPNVRFDASNPGREVLRDLYRWARGFVFAAEEDFGIAPLEAQACGCPVIALGRGGTAETVVPGETGVLYEEQSAESLVGALRNFDPRGFDTARLRAHAERFSRERFAQEFAEVARETLRPGLSTCARGR
jgi:glycosyltransferase involved in cell wall biosynthesis